MLLLFPLSGASYCTIYLLHIALIFITVKLNIHFVILFDF